MASLVVIFFTLSLISLIDADIDENTTESPKLTVAPIVIGFLETAMGNGANLTAEYCEWNVSNIITQINQTDPEFLYDSSSIGLLTTYIPPYIIKQFPSQLLQFHNLNYTNTTAEDLCVSMDQCIDL